MKKQIMSISVTTDWEGASVTIRHYDTSEVNKQGKSRMIPSTKIYPNVTKDSIARARRAQDAIMGGRYVSKI